MTACPTQVTGSSVLLRAIWQESDQTQTGLYITNPRNSEEWSIQKCPGNFNFPVAHLSTKNKEWTKIYVQGHELILVHLNHDALVTFVGDCLYSRLQFFRKIVWTTSATTSTTNLYLNSISVKATAYGSVYLAKSFSRRRETCTVIMIIYVFIHIDETCNPLRSCFALKK